MHFQRLAFYISISAAVSAADIADVADGPPVMLDDYIVETNPATFDLKAPAVTQQVVAADLKTMNLSTTAAALRNLPNLFIRERFIGDKNAPIGMRGTSNRQSGRTLVLADGILLSNFLGTGFGNSPRWFLLAPEEIEKIAVIYGPFSALYAGNSIGGTVLFTTSMPSAFSAHVKGQFFEHSFDEFGTHDRLSGSNVFASIGDRVGNFSYYALYNHLDNRSASTQFWTINESATGAPNSGGVLVSGAAEDTDFSRRPRLIYGAEGPTSAVHDLFKLKLGYELSSVAQLRYTLAYWKNSEDRDQPETYLRDAQGNEIWSGKVEFEGKTFSISPSQFSFSQRDQADVINALMFAYDAPSGWQAVVTANLYDVLKDKQYTSTAVIPIARTGGAGQAAITGRTGWESIDAKLGYRRLDGWLEKHAPTIGYHFDHYFNIANQYNLADWRDGASRTSLLNGTGGATVTQAFYAQDVWSFAPNWSLTPGIRWEHWKAKNGYSEKDFGGSRVRAEFPERQESALSPKIALGWRPLRAWQARLSFGEAYRFPTVGELFQGSVSPNGSVTNNDPNLRPERALDKDLTIERRLGSNGSARLSVFDEDVRRALISQSTLQPDGTSFTGTQNVGRIRARGVEFAMEQKHCLHESITLDFAVSYTDAKIRDNDPVLVGGVQFSTIGKQVPRIPYWQLRGGLTWSPSARFSWSAQVRTASRQFNTLENSDPYGGYGGVDSYTVIDTKATCTLMQGTTFSLGCDNLNNCRYHVFHPMPERTWYAEVTWSQ
ncbi:MAG TPA: TonB-dependent receptor [Opitutaceae bacterium]|nr:TonB-dependent receptor [Opitutaceae bacterium]